MKKVAISLSEEALHTVDRCARLEGISRSAWFERAARRARRREGLRTALRQAQQDGIRPGGDAELEALRREIENAG